MFQKQICVLASASFLLFNSVFAEDVVPVLAPINTVNSESGGGQNALPTTQSNSSVNTDSQSETSPSPTFSERVQIFRPETDPVFTLDGRVVL